jgi:hypothetical protein
MLGGQGKNAFILIEIPEYEMSITKSIFTKAVYSFSF